MGGGRQRRRIQLATAVALGLAGSAHASITTTGGISLVLQGSSSAAQFGTANNLGLATDGSVDYSLAGTSTGPSYVPARGANLANDGTYGDASSWIATNDPNLIANGGLGSDYLAVDLDGLKSVSNIAFGRDQTGGFNDRSAGVYTLQYTQVVNPSGNMNLAVTGNPATGWATIGTVDNETGGGNNTGNRHDFTFKSVQATGMRLVVPLTPNDNLNVGSNQIAIDELEAYSRIKPTAAGTVTGYSTVASLPSSAKLGEKDVALSSNGGTAFASSVLTGYAAHSIAHLNDGTFGNNNSWIPNFGDQGDTNSGGRPYAGIALAGPTTINAVAWGRDTLGNDNTGGPYTDRNAGTYTLQYTTDANPTGASNWITISDMTYGATSPYGVDSTPWERHLYEFSNIADVTGVRLLVPYDGGNGDKTIDLDELEVYAVPEPASIGLAGIGALGLLARRRRR